ncbi:MAG TPA: nucleotide exchange factor GrpE [Thermoflexia bacterium]|nr:nucleotide exchange factor GrpE [Thermoflexia bacterium]
MSKNKQEKETVELTRKEEQDITVTAETANLPDELEIGMETVSASEPAEELDAEQSKLAALEATIIQLETEAARNIEGWRRTQASFENYRKRTEAEKLRWRTVDNAALLMRLLPLVDDFDRAFASIPAEIEGNPWLEGIQLIEKKLQNLLEIEQVKPIQVEPGHEFDPHYHEAIHAQVFEGFAAEQIISVVQRGYLQDKLVLRPAKVVVALDPEPEPEPTAIIEMDATENDQTPGTTE